MDLPLHASEERDYITMMRTLTVVRQYLAAACLVVIGLVAYGCGDSATVNPVVELASLTVDPGTLRPAFSGGTTQYTVDVSSNITSVTIAAQPAVAGDSVTINGQATTSSVIPLGASGTTTPVNIVVSESGTNSRTYTVLIVRAGLTGNNSLQNLTVSPGTLDSPFTANDLNYSVDVANTVGSVTVTPTLSDPAATMTVNGQPTNSGQARTVTLNPAGQPTNIPIIVTAQNGTPKTYQVTVSRGVSGNNNLGSLTVLPGTLNPAFIATTTIYRVDVASTVASVTVTPTRQDPNATITVNGTPATSGQARAIPLNGAGSPTPINIVVTAQNGSQKLYTIEVRRAALGGNNNLQSLTVSPGTLTPAFNANTLSYTVDVATTVTSVSVTPTRQDPAATITVNGTSAPSGQPRAVNLNPAGQATIIQIMVTAQNGTQKTYFITANRAALGGNNSLQSLTVSPGTLTPAFNANTLSYTVDVASTVASITVTPTRQDPAATITVNGTPAPSGQPRAVNLNPAGQATIIQIMVTAQNGTQKTYFITANRAALGGNNSLQSLTVSPGTLTPAFNANTLSYTADVASTVDSITVTPTRQDPAATITVNGTPATSGQGRSITLNGAGFNTLVNIVVTAPNGSQKIYTITVERAALGGNNNLSALTVSPGSLTPAFTAARTSYTVNVGSGVGNINVTATKADSNASMTINGQGTNSGQTRSISLNPAGESTEIEIIVIAPNGNQKPYLITANRAALGGNNNLSALTVAPGSLDPAFNENTTGYTVNVGSAVTAVTVTATLQDTAASMTINGQGTSSGQARDITLGDLGSNTNIDILVTAPSGVQKTYSILANRSATTEPPTPTVAPDLIREDDSCSTGVPPDECAPPTSKEDNVTNVARPRFTVPPPGSGETAKLYINGSEVPSSFNSGNNTLRPNADLVDGSYGITYTLSNAGGESDQSPAMTPPLQINTTAP